MPRKKGDYRLDTLRAIRTFAGRVANMVLHSEISTIKANGIISAQRMALTTFKIEQGYSAPTQLEAQRLALLKKLREKVATEISQAVNQVLTDDENE